MIVLNPSHTTVLEKTNEVIGLCVFSRKDTVHFLALPLYKQSLFYSDFQTINIRCLNVSCLDDHKYTNSQYEFCGKHPCLTDLWFQENINRVFKYHLRNHFLSANYCLSQLLSSNFTRHIQWLPPIFPMKQKKDPENYICQIPSTNKHIVKCWLPKTKMAITKSWQEKWRHKSWFGAENGLRASFNSGLGFRSELLHSTGGWMWGSWDCFCGSSIKCLFWRSSL